MLRKGRGCRHRQCRHRWLCHERSNFVKQVALDSFHHTLEAHLHSCPRDSFYPANANYHRSRCAFENLVLKTARMTQEWGQKVQKSVALTVVSSAKTFKEACKPAAKAYPQPETETQSRNKRPQEWRQLLSSCVSETPMGSPEASRDVVFSP